MLMKEIEDILLESRELGWVLEPRAKRLLSLAQLDVPRFKWATDLHSALHFAREIGYPLVAKIVSGDVIHKSDLAGVDVGINGDKALRETFQRFSRFPGFSGVLVEEMLTGLELIVGAKVDYQFGPVILFGIGGTGVEIYQDTTLRMAPLNEKDVRSMARGLKASALLEGYRGSEPINLEALTRMMLAFSDLVMKLEGLIDSVDLNPVMCSSEKCVVADARIMLHTNSPIPT